MESVVYYADPTAADQGAAGTRTIKGLVTAIGSTKQATIVLAHTSSSTNTTYTVSTDLTVSSNITVKVDRGALVAPATGKTLTISGPLEAGLYQVFTGDGDVEFSEGGTVYPEWWGIDGTADQIQIIAAIKSLSSGGTVKLSEKTYTISGVITLRSNITLEGVHGSTIIDTVAAFGDTQMVRAYASVPQQENIHIKNIKFDGGNNITFTPLVPGSANPGAHAVHLDSVNNASVRDCIFLDVKGDAVYVGTSLRDGTRGNDILVTGNYAENCERDFVTDIGGERHIYTNNIIKGCKLNGFDIEPDTDDTVGDILIANNIIEDTGYRSILIAYLHITTDTNKGPANVIGNIINGSGTWGISIDKAIMANVVGNFVSDCDSGIFSSLGSEKTNIQGNYIYDIDTYGIAIRDGSGTVSGNFIKTATGDGIYNGADSGGVITGNTIFVSTGHGIYTCSDAADNIISNNYVDGVSITAGKFGLYDENSKRNIYIGNIVKNFARGAYILYNVSDSTFFGFNIFKDNTIDIEDLRRQIGAVTLAPYGVSYLYSQTGAVTATLPDGINPGDMKVIRMTNAVNPSTVSVTHHETSNPEVFTFNHSTDVLILQWNGLKWVTISNIGVGV